MRERVLLGRVNIKIVKKAWANILSCWILEVVVGRTKNVQCHW